MAMARRQAPLVRTWTPERQPFAMSAELYATVRTIQADVDRKAGARPR
jgi:hypothetical protein